MPREVKRRQSYIVFSFLGVLLFSVFPVVNWCDPSDHVTPGAYSPCDHWGLELHCESLGNKGQCMSSILPRRTNKTSNHTPSLSHFFPLPYLQSKICPSQLGKCRFAYWSWLRKHFQFAAGPSDSIIQPRKISFSIAAITSVFGLPLLCFHSLSLIGYGIWNPGTGTFYFKVTHDKVMYIL